MRYLVRAKLKPGLARAALDAINRRTCRHENGTEPWSCDSCDCTRRLERNLARKGHSFLDWLRREAASTKT
ncbi:MAG TPA: hypothetical protein VFX89_11935 [Gammaproteobacteria bacterium]|nr:hypothetical protein [Gammaproteobacteria bacterium]